MPKKEKGKFRSVEGENEYTNCYNDILSKWPVPKEEISLTTTFGETNIIVSGKDNEPTIVLLHALTTGSVMWFFAAKMLSKNHRVCAIDIIGDAGKSRARRLPQTADEYSTWLVEVFEQLHLNKPVLIGASYGASIALHYAIDHQEEIERLILLFPPFGLVRTKPSLILKILPYSFLMNEKKAEKLLSLMCSDSSRLDKDLRKLLVLSALHFNPHTVMMKPYSDSTLQKIDIPMTYVVGEKEIFFDREQALKRIERNISHCKRVVIPGMKHIGTSEELNKINDILDMVLHREGR